MSRVTVARRAFESRYGDGAYVGDERMSGRLVTATAGCAVVHLEKLDRLYVFSLNAVKTEDDHV